MKKRANPPDDLEALERLLVRSTKGTYVLTLYISGSTPRSARAIENIRNTCEAHLKGRYELTVIDIYQQPELAKGKDIVAVPTLVKELPLPLRRLIGDLSNIDRIHVALELEPDES